ncbi:MAG: MgtC/SapB family protein [Nitrospirae bacterium]|nr:MgtC/SapB family protein [Nitrospirota bacterium]
MDLLVDSGKLLLAAALGGAIGFEREAHGQAAGFRTYLVVSTGSCLMMLLSLHLEAIFHTYNAGVSIVRLDPGRIASYTLAGMGFLGAGAIIKGKGSVRGLTTAAGLWVVTGTGLSVGAGFIYQSVTTTFIMLVALYWVKPIRRISPNRIYSILTTRFREGSRNYLPLLEAVMADIPTIHLQRINYEHDITAKTIIYRIRLYGTNEQAWIEIVDRISKIEGIETIKWEESDVP